MKFRNNVKKKYANIHERNIDKLAAELTAKCMAYIGYEKA